MPSYGMAGEIPGKDRGCSRSPDGGGHVEDLMREQGSAPGPSSRRVRPPAASTARGGLPDGAAAAGLVPNHPLPFRAPDLPRGGDLVLGRRSLLANDDAPLPFMGAAAPSELYRNSAGHQTISRHYGSAGSEPKGPAESISALVMDV
jgi:hypothetical protein